MCTSLNENRAEIEAELAVLESRSNERRLSGTTAAKVSSFELGSDMILMLACYCDEDNPGNEGCTKRQLIFADATMRAIVTKTKEEFTNDPMNAMSEVRNTLTPTCQA